MASKNKHALLNITYLKENALKYAKFAYIYHTFQYLLKLYY